MIIRSCIKTFRIFVGLISRKIFPPFGLLVHCGFDLKLAVEIVLGRIDGDAPADFAVGVEPREILIFRLGADHAVGNAERDNGDLARGDFDVFEFGEIVTMT
jgi:hypothetical protein